MAALILVLRPRPPPHPRPLSSPSSPSSSSVLALLSVFLPVLFVVFLPVLFVVLCPLRRRHPPRLVVVGHNSRSWGSFIRVIQWSGCPACCHGGRGVGVCCCTGCIVVVVVGLGCRGWVIVVGLSWLGCRGWVVVVVFGLSWWWLCCGGGGCTVVVVVVLSSWCRGPRYACVGLGCSSFHPSGTSSSLCHPQLGLCCRRSPRRSCPV